MFTTEVEPKVEKFYRKKDGEVTFTDEDMEEFSVKYEAPDGRTSEYTVSYDEDDHSVSMKGEIGGTHVDKSIELPEADDWIDAVLLKLKSDPLVSKLKRYEH